jgi:hypothetical protein
MTTSQSRKSARHARWLSTGQGRARSDITLWSQIVQQFTELHATRRSFISRFTVAQLAKSTRSQSTGSPAALKDAMRRTKGSRGLFVHSFVHHHG